MRLTLDEIRAQGLAALPVGMIRFLLQFETGRGDYARESREWVDKTSLSDIRAAASRRRGKKK